MPHAVTNFSPADPGALETSTYSFSFANALASGETITSATFTLSVQSGVDASVASRLIGSIVIAGPNVAQQIGGLVAGVTYTAVATIVTSQGQTLTLYAEIPCVSVW